MVARVSDKNISVIVYVHTFWTCHLRERSWNSITVIAGLTNAGHSSDNAGAIELVALANSMVAKIRDVKVTRGINCDTGRATQLRLRRRNIVAVICLDAITG